MKNRPHHQHAGRLASGKTLGPLLMAAALMGMKPMNVMAAMNFQFTEITVPGGITPGAFGINNQGTIVGNYCPPDSPTVVWGFIERRGVFTDVAIPGAGGDPNPVLYGLNWLAELNGINDAGVIVGYVAADPASFSSGVGLHGFLWHDGRYAQIDYPGALGTSCSAVNEAGQIVGWYVDASQNTHAFLLQVQHGFLLSDGVYTTVDFPGQTGNELYGINDHGEMVGNYNYENNAFRVTILEP